MMRRITRAELEELTNEELARGHRELDQLLEEWRAYRATVAAEHPDLPPGAALAMFCVIVHDNPGTSSRTLAGLLVTALWRLDRLSP